MAAHDQDMAALRAEISELRQVIDSLPEVLHRALVIDYSQSLAVKTELARAKPQPPAA